MAARVLCVAGARPNFIKVAPLLGALRKSSFEAVLVHTGQHYDAELSKVFFEDLAIPAPDFSLGVGSASHAVQTAEIMSRFEPVLHQLQPQVVIVVGDVNSTIACALVAAKFELDRPFACRGDFRRRPLVGHVEAGLRSFDPEMPEETNRKLTDAIADLLFVSDPAGVENLAREGVAPERVFFVGNVMIDTLVAAKNRAMQSTVLERLTLEHRGYAVLTLHRPSNVDDPSRLRQLLGTIDDIAGDIAVVFPVHPRTAGRLSGTAVDAGPPRWRVTPPLGYLDFLKLMAMARFVLTDSGGIQEETTVLGVPCLTLRDNTERPVTIDCGTNRLAGTDPATIRAAFAAMRDAPPGARLPPKWDGRAADRVVEALEAWLAPA